MFYQATMTHLGKQIWHNIAIVRDNLDGWRARDWKSCSAPGSCTSMPLYCWQSYHFCMSPHFGRRPARRGGDLACRMACVQAMPRIPIWCAQRML